MCPRKLTVDSSRCQSLIHGQIYRFALFIEWIETAKFTYCQTAYSTVPTACLASKDIGHDSWRATWNASKNHSVVCRLSLRERAFFRGAKDDSVLDGYLRRVLKSSRCGVWATRRNLCVSENPHPPAE